MIDLISALVANGTTFAGWGYQSWLPFYNYGLIIPFLAFLVAVTISGRWAINFLIATSLPLLFTSVLAESLDMNPRTVFGVWLTLSALNLLSVKMKWNPLKFHIHDPEWTLEEIKEHIRTQHPEEWKRVWEEEEKENAD